jgi:hypothetical protein
MPEAFAISVLPSPWDFDSHASPRTPAAFAFAMPHPNALQIHDREVQKSQDDRFWYEPLNERLVLAGHVEAGHREIGI